MSSRVFKGMKRWAFPLVLIIALGSVFHSQVKGAPRGGGRRAVLGSSVAGGRKFASAYTAFEKGEYEAALKAFNKVARGRNRGYGLLGAARVLMETGQYKRAESLLGKAARDKRVALVARTESARLDMHTGNYERAGKTLEAVIKVDRLQFEARILRGRLLLIQGNKIAANAVFKSFFNDVDNGFLSRENPHHLVYLGMAAHGQEDWQEASNLFEKASKKAPNNIRVWLEWAALSMKKYRVDWADDFYKKVLKINPNHPEALAGLAWVEWYAPRSNHHKGKERAKKALEINPKCVEARLYLAGLDIFDAKYPGARKSLAEALKVNPNYPRTLALKAAVHYLNDEKTDFEKMKKRALEINSHDGGFFNLAGKFVSRHHRYAEAAELNKKALQFDPQNADALADLGVNQLRTGDYGMGWFNLKEAYKLDGFNHKTVNLLTLHDNLSKRYDWYERGKIRFLFPKDEVKLLSRYVPKVLNGAVKSYLKKYNYKPHIPVYMELYDKAEDFQARTFGEPAETGILGVCFGKVVTSMSPSLGRTNWAYVLWHELAHVIHVQMTKGRVERWFTEGLAEYETLLARPEWKRQHSRMLYRKLATGNLTSVLELNLGFTRSKSIQGVIMAYYQSTFVMEYIHKRWGWDKIVESLHAYAKGGDTDRVFRQVLGVEPEAFDGAFVEHLKERLSHYHGQFDPLQFLGRDLAEYRKSLEETIMIFPKKAGSKGSGDLDGGNGKEKGEKNDKSSRKDGIRNIASGKLRKDLSSVPARAQAELAMIYIMSRNAAQAKKLMESASKSSRTDPYVRYARGLAYRAARKHKEEKATLLELAKDGYDSFEGRMRLGDMAEKKKAHKEAVQHYIVASKLDPEAASPLVKLAFLYKEMKKDAPLVDVLYKLAFIQQTSASIVYSAIKRASKLKQWDRVRKLGPLGIHNQPFNALIHEKYAWALRAGGEHEKAIFEFESALLCKPNNKEYIHIGIARSHLALGRKDKALQHVDKALDVDPNFPPAVRLLKKLKG